MSQTKNFPLKIANQNEIAFYCVMGEALCMVQEVESALSHSITLKKNHTANEEFSDRALLKHHQSYTLGQAVKLSENEKLYSSSLQKDLSDFNQQRNWLIHKVIFETRSDPILDPIKHNLYQKVQSISKNARSILRAIEQDMLDFCTSKGRDMSGVIAEIEKWNNAI